MSVKRWMTKDPAAKGWVAVEVVAAEDYDRLREERDTIAEERDNVLAARNYKSLIVERDEARALATQLRKAGEAMAAWIRDNTCSSDCGDNCQAGAAALAAFDACDILCVAQKWSGTADTARSRHQEVES